MVTVIDGRNLIHGRLASVVAERIMDGEEIVVLNAEAIVITGVKENVFADFKAKVDQGEGRPRRHHQEEGTLLPPQGGPPVQEVRQGNDPLDHNLRKGGLQEAPRLRRHPQAVPGLREGEARAGLQEDHRQIHDPGSRFQIPGFQREMIPWLSA